MSDNRDILSRVKIEFLGRIAATVFSSLLVILLARFLGADDYGFLFFTISLFSIIGIVTKLGIGRSAGRYIAEYNKKDPDQVPNVIKISLIYNIISIGFVLIILYFTFSGLVEFIGEPRLHSFFIIGLLFLTFSTLETYVRRVLQGLEAIRLAALLRVLHYSSKLFFATGFVLLGLGALGAFWGYMVSYAIATIIGLVFIYGKFYRNYDTSASMADGLARRIGEYTIPLTVTDTAHIVDKHIDTVLVGMFLTPVAVGYYTIGKQAVKFIEAPASAVGFTLSPTFGAQKASGDIDEASRLYESTLVYSLLLYVPALAGLFLVAEPTIEVVFGSEYLGAAPVLQIFVFYALLQAVMKVTSDGLDYLGRAKQRAIIRTIASILNIVLNIILIIRYGVVGAAIATVISYLLYTVVNLYLIHLEFNLRTEYLLRRFGGIIAISLVMSTVVFLSLSAVNGVISLLASITLGALVWFILSVTTGYLDIHDISSLFNITP